MDKQPTRAVAYIRVSTGKQVEHGVSIPAQIAKVELYSKLYQIEVVETVIDRGCSAKNLERDGLKKALGMLDSGVADALLIVKLDRLTRSVKDLWQLLESYFGREGGPSLICVSEQVDTRTAAGRLVLSVLMSVAQWERETISERTSAAMQHLKSEGRYTGGNAPYGWNVGLDGVLKPNPIEQKAMARAKQLREKNISLRKIGKTLANEGHHPRNGGGWHATSVNTLIRGRLHVT